MVLELIFFERTAEFRLSVKNNDKGKKTENSPSNSGGNNM